MNNNTIAYEGCDADFVLSALQEAIFLWGKATLADYRKLTGGTVEPDDHMYIWTQMMLDDYTIERFGNTCILKLPKPARM